jgi:hypothetical protein
VEAYIRSLPIRSSFVYLAFFYTNIMEYYVPQREADGLTFAIYLPPHVPMPFVDPLTATGPAVREMFDHPTQYVGQTLPVIGEILSAQEMVDTFVRVTGQGRAAPPLTRAKTCCATFRPLAPTSTSCASWWAWWNTPSNMAITPPSAI